MTRPYRGRDDQGHLMPPPKYWKAGNPSDFCNVANDNFKGPWPLIPFPDIFPVSQAANSIAAVRRALRGYIVVVAYGIVAFTATIAWFYLLGLTVLTAVEWALS